MTVIKIERIRDTYICTNDKGNQCHYDIVSHETIGYSGKPLKHISNILRPFTKIVANTPQKEFVDRLISLELLPWDTLSGNCDFFINYRMEEGCSVLMETKAEWKKTLKNLRESDRNWYSLVELVNYLLTAQKKERMNIPKFNIVNFDALLNDSWYTARVSKCFSKDWSAKVFVKWMAQVDNHFNELDRSYYLLNGKHYDPKGADHWGFCPIKEAFQRNLDYFSEMIDLKDTYPELIYDEKKSIIENANQWRADAQVLKNKEASKRFGEVQTEKDYTYTSGEYSVTVPTTYADCQKISDTFGNCVAHFYWDNYLSKGKRVVVIINKNDAPVICCGIDRGSKKIVDYLKSHNRDVTSNADLAFKAEYQEYLKSLI